MPFSCCCTTTGAQPLLTQSAFFVNSATGNDANDGLTEATAIASLKELARRVAGRIIPQDVTIQLRGTFPTEPLILEATVLPGFTMRVWGDTPIVVFNGNINVYTPMNAGAGTANQQSDLAHAYAADQYRRVRITTPAVAAARDIYWIAKDLGGNTARISQPINVETVISTKALSAGVPVNADTYAIETLVTTVNGASIVIRGGGEFVAQDLLFLPLGGTQAFKNNMFFSEGPLQCFLGGCLLDAANGFVFYGNPLFCSCQFKDGCTPTQTIMTQYGGITRGNAGPTQIGVAFTLYQGNPIFQSVASSPLAPSRGTNVLISGTGIANGGMAFYDCTSADAIVTLSRASSLEVRAAALLWGITNTAPHGVKVFNGCGMTYEAANKPTLTGNVAGQDALVGNVNKTWAAIPFTNAPPDNASLNLRQ